MTDEQIKHMVGRFLAWKLPEGFNPDGGVTFERVANNGTPHEYKFAPSGTNLLDGTQAEAMVRYMVEGIDNPMESSVLQDDLRDMLRALGLPDAARPQSPHAVFRECIAEVEKLRRQR